MRNVPRGIRNNNPGNLRKGDDWRGLSEEQSDPSFCVFVGPLWGLRALARVLLNYQRKRGLRTIAEIIGRWAPSNENDTAAYIAAVAGHLHVAPKSPLDLEDRCTLFLFVEAIVRRENGVQPYGGDIIQAALTAAGIGRAKEALE